VLELHDSVYLIGVFPVTFPDPWFAVVGSKRNELALGRGALGFAVLEEDGVAGWCPATLHG